MEPLSKGFDQLAYDQQRYPTSTFQKLSNELLWPKWFIFSRCVSLYHLPSLASMTSFWFGKKGIYSWTTKPKLVPDIWETEYLTQAKKIMIISVTIIGHGLSPEPLPLLLSSIHSANYLSIFPQDFPPLVLSSTSHSYAAKSGKGWIKRHKSIEIQNDRGMTW